MLPIARLRPDLTPFVTALARGSGADPGDLEQQVWLQALEHTSRSGAPRDQRAWLRGLAVREALRPRPPEKPTARVMECHPDPQEQLLAAERQRAVRRALAALPGRCPELMATLARSPELTYRQVAERLGMPRGSIGPVRSRCLSCLRVLLAGRRGE